jgi:hypothetical protein
MRQKFLFELADLKECSQTVIESLKNALHHILWAVWVNWLVLLIQDDVNQEERELGLWSAECLDLISGIVSVIDLEGVLDNATDG